MAEVDNVIEIEGERRDFPLTEVMALTKNFDEGLVIGAGGFGKVYKASLEYLAGDSGQHTKELAIKRLNAESKQGVGEFWNEINLLSMLRHPHLVSLLGYCNAPPEMILVYDYMDHGALASHLYNATLGWERRLQICIGAARGLVYLHYGKDHISPVIHRDVKSTNILLDANWVPKICDFGLCRTPKTNSSTHVSTDVKGTIGYVDPEYSITTRLTPKSDVYSFGVVLLEILCGRKAVDRRLETEKVGLAQWVNQCMREGKFDIVVDQFVREEIGPQCLGDFAKLAKSCLEQSSKNRPTMAEVLKRLESIQACQERESKEGGSSSTAGNDGMFGSPDTVEQKAPNSSNDSPTLFFCCFKRRGRSRS